VINHLSSDTSSDVKYVIVRGTILYREEVTDVMLQFRIYDDGGFELDRLEFDDIRQNRQMQNILIEAINNEF